MANIVVGAIAPINPENILFIAKISTDL
ncbi:hypothetical protein kac68v162_gp044 [Nodularia phage vB_NspS-kac68v162]|uniref:Uncharacterized protein n=1 Tax=Nodularia phage vB_NspS-kac68v162 TaxID=2557583 RepID=A0A482MKS3_9CAUD|nr:hypothetical protein kac68v162_gp044 [Nodularia phage vB_NspS-kac68v162]